MLIIGDEDTTVINFSNFIKLKTLPIDPFKCDTHWAFKLQLYIFASCLVIKSYDYNHISFNLTLQYNIYSKQYARQLLCLH